MSNQKKNKKPQKKWKRIVKTVILTLLIGGILFLVGWYAYNTLTAKYRRTFTGYTVQTGDITETNEYSGKISLVDSASYTAGSAGTVRQLYVSAGDEVKKNDMLLRMKDGTVYRADFDGRVNTVSVKEGDEVAAGAALMTLADFTHMRITIRVDEYDIPSLSVGQECTVTITATEAVHNATISSIDYANSMGNSIAYYSTVVKMDVDDTILPGMQVTVSFTETLASDTAILRKKGLSFDEQNSAYVWLKDENGEPVQQYVQIGVYNDDNVQILSGLKAGDVAYVENENTTTAATGLLSMFSFGNSFGGGAGSGSGRGSWSGGPGSGSSGGWSGGPGGSSSGWSGGPGSGSRSGGSGSGGGSR